MDLNVHINLAAPDLTRAIFALLAHTTAQPETPCAPLPPAAPQAPTPVPVSAPIAQQAPAVVPAAAIPTPVATPVATPAPVAPVAPPPAPVPTATPAAYTLETLAGAAAPLVQAGRQPELLALLGQFGVQAMGQLKAEQYGAFATALRQMGGKI